MTTLTNTLLLWAPRVLGIAVCLFLSIFALDAFGPGKPMGQALADFAIHVTPMGLLLGVVALSWRWPSVGAVVFIGLAAAYAFMTRSHTSWMLVISGPLLVVGVLFLANWVGGRPVRRAA